VPWAGYHRMPDRAYATLPNGLLMIQEWF